ncbi:MAG: hypothetical protein ACTSX6_10530 [Candidatus Heimdallarchaeaceae archaeon]
MEIPWYAQSPSPFSIAWYCLYGYVAHRNGFSWRDSVWLVGFVVLSGDLIWVAASGLRFGWFYPDSVPQLILCAARDFAGMLFCLIMLKTPIKFNDLTVLGYITNIVFMLIWFLLAPSPAYTDWTYAIKHNYPLPTIITAFIFSHIIGRIILLCIVKSFGE